MLVYIAINKKNFKAYVGQTIHDLDVRKKQHQYISNKSGVNGIFKRAVKKYGVDGFVWCVLEQCSSVEVLNERETFYIDNLATLSPAGYNLLPGGGNRTVHARTRALLSKAGRGRKASAETRKKMSEIAKMREYPPERCHNVSKAKLGKKWGAHTEDTKQRMRSSQKHKKAIALVNQVSGEVRVFVSINLAADTLNLRQSHLSSVFHGRRNHTGGWALYTPQQNGAVPS